ncbi:Coenzyme F420 hydrogenase/dehydrogenase, beta subunit C-terminal domain [Spirochaetota bacterium]
MREELNKHMEISKTGFSALKKVIEYSCSRCGLCASLCPTGAITMKKTIPTLTGKCTKCGLCYQGCPRSFYPVEKVNEKYFGTPDNEVEERVGKCTDNFTTRSLNDEIFSKGANGGTTTALLSYLLEKKKIDAVLHLESIHKDCYVCHHAETRVSTKPEDVLKGAKSKNMLTPVLHDLKRISKYKKFAVVGLSCQVMAIRKLQVIKDDPEMREAFKALAKRAEKLIGNLKYVIGINCFSSTKYGGIDKIYKKFKVREQDVIKYAEDTKKSLYQFLNEDKNFFWYVRDGFMTKDGKFYPFEYTSFLDETIPMGCMVCPSFIVCKAADVSIGVTASETKLKEFGYNSVFVRNPQLGKILDKMVSEEKLLKRPMWENKGKFLRRFVEKMIKPSDLINFQEYVGTGKWKPSDDLYKRASSVQSGKIMGLQRLFLAQTVKKNMMYLPANDALKENDKHVTEIV